MQAAAISVYTLLVFTQCPWPATLAALVFYTYEDILDCVLSVRDHHLSMTTYEFSVVRQRYLKHDHHKVAQLLPQVCIPQHV
jgi:hypothetical protein